MKIDLEYTWFPFLIFFASTLFFFSISIDESLWNLENTLLAGGGDGLKNYYTFSYLYSFGEGIMFTGMLYPYGDLATYTDAQPFVVWVLQSLRWCGIDLSEHLLLVLNILPILSFPIAGVFLFRIARHYGLPFYFSIVAVIFCLGLSPQIFRIQSHYALSYACIFPVYWFLHLQYRALGLNRNVAYLILLALSVAFIHPYHMFMLSLFMMGYVAVGILRRENVLIEVIIALTPIILFLVIMTSLDNSHTRPANPYGLLEYKTELSDLLPFYGPISYLKKPLDLRSNFHEGYAYPGILFIVFLIAGLLLLIMRKRKVLKWTAVPLHLRHYFLSSLLVLGFAMGLHIILTGGYIVDFIGPLKQFRGLGRTSWPFYYVCFIFTTVWFYLFINQRSPYIKYGALTIGVIFYFLDTISYHKNLNQNISKYKSVDLLKEDKTISEILAEHHRDPSNFQAVITLPSSTEGAEKISFDNDWYIKQYGLAFSAQTGMPLTACIMSRTPLYPVLRILEISSSNYVRRSVVDDLKRDKPLLVIIGNERVEEFSDVLSRAESIGSNDRISIYSLSMEGMRHYDKVSRSILDTSILVDPVIDYYPDTSDFYFKGFEDSVKAEDEVMTGNGSYFLNQGSGLLLNQDIKLEVATDFTLSFWYLIQKDKSSVPSFRVELSEHQSSVLVDNFRDWDFERVEVYGNWIRMIRKYTVTANVTNIKVSVFGNHTIVDNLLFCKNNTTTYFELQDSSKAYYDHHIVHLSSPNI